MDLTKRVKSMRIGQSFYVQSEAERQEVLRAAKVLGYKIFTQGNKKTGRFRCTRVLPA